MLNYEENNQYIAKAKAEAVQAWSNSSAGKSRKLDVSQMYVCWFSKTLQNWKALVSTDAYDGVYIEVTYDGDALQCYVDIYTRVVNCAISDEALNM